jgi:hypothetical protein
MRLTTPITRKMTWPLTGALGNDPGQSGAASIYYGPAVLSIPGGTVSAVGDSYTTGTGASPSTNRFINVFATAVGGTVTNLHGVAGTLFQNSNDSGGNPSANNGRDSVGSLFDEQIYDYLVNAYGGFNDSRSDPALVDDISSVNFEVDKRQWLNAVLNYTDTGSMKSYSTGQVILCGNWWAPAALFSAGGLTGSNYTILQAYDDVDRAVALEYGLPFANTYAVLRDFSAGAGVVWGDNIHPSNAGHALIANAIQHPLILWTRPRLTVTSDLSTGNAVTLNWTAPSGEVPTSYTSEIMPPGEPYEFTVTWTGSGLTHQFTGLTGGNKYLTRTRPNYADGSHGPWAFLQCGVKLPYTVVASSDFANVADNTTLESVSGWSRITSGSNGNSPTIQVNNGRGRVVGPTSATSVGRYKLTSLTDSGNGVYGECELEFLSLPGLNFIAGLTLRAQDASVDNLHLRISSTSILLEKTLSGTSTIITGGNFPWTPQINTPYTFRFEVKANVQKVYVNGNLIISSTEAEAGLGALGTSAGLRLQTGTGSVFTDTTGPQVNKCEFGTIN